MRHLACIINKNSRKAAKSQRTSELKNNLEKNHFSYYQLVHSLNYSCSNLCAFAPLRDKFFRIIKFIYGVGLVVLLMSCSEIFEVDISNEPVTLLAPHDSLVTTMNAQTFWWDYVENADHYQLQIVTPDFELVRRLYLDTTIVVNSFDFALDPGIYQWRVRALNSAYQTAFSTHNLTIDSTLDLSWQTVVLIYPNASDTLNTPEIEFAWQNLYNAMEYRFQLSNAQGIIEEIFTENTLINVQITSDDGAYNWKVMAQNSMSSTPFSEGVFYLDTTPPAIPQLISPENSATLTNGVVQFSWSANNTGGSSIVDSLFVFSDPAQSELLIGIQSKNNQHTDTLSAGAYYWKVRSWDVAGNYSEFSELRNFTVK